ncbi:hypothetical protein D9619_006731 [Psilocybe cf. subviscida]|uniref:Mid2 domain-containing protein n=1 Tax=Psilocybe cf. subviscida TaxID=2480587 RepID=A0A8H5B4M2_9AGAR|nr:hypothetical protein D9619_006731 [Psilocybe cf. subviscida]
MVGQPLASPWRSASRLPASSCSLLLLPWLQQVLLGLLFASQTTAAPGDPPSFLNISIPLASPKIVYTPFLCNATQAIASPQICAGGWQAAAAPSSSPLDPIFVSVSPPGPNTGSSNLIPQLFFQFRASALFFQAIPPSNATATVTINSNGAFLSRQFDSSLGSAVITGIPGDVSSLFTITIVPQTGPTVFFLQSIIVTADADISLSSLFPSATLPPSASLPIFPSPTPQSTSSSLSSASSTPLQTGVVGSNTKKKIAEAVGITIGLGLGLTALAVLGFIFWRKRRRRRRDELAAASRKEGRAEKRRRNGNGNGNGNRNGNGSNGYGNERGRPDQEVSQNANSPQSEWSSDSPPRHRPRWPV